ncbi:MAG: N-acetylmuramoyl-L-alanine amidase [bacterium]
MTKRRIINHWTAGNFKPNLRELLHYHLLIDDRGKLYLGYKNIEENDNCYDGSYTAHTGGGNTRSVGIAVCGMSDFKSIKNPGNLLLTKIQLERLFETNAIQLYREGWEKATKDNLLTHYEFGLLHPHTSSRGKIDIIYLPPFPDIKPNEVGDFIRNKTNWYLKNIKTRIIMY